MEKRELGKTGILVTPVGIGTNTIGTHNFYDNIDENVSREIVKTALNTGVDFFDTAYMYGLGRSEELIGEVLQEENKRKEVVLASKAAHEIVNGETLLNNSPEFLTKAVDISLKRLKTDYIDLFYIHFPDGKTPPAEAVGALQRLKEAGKIRSIGISNFGLEGVKAANQDGYVDVLQSRYALVYPEAEVDLIPYCMDNHVTFIPYTPLASGLLTGKYTLANRPTDFRKDRPIFQGKTYENIVTKVEQLKIIAAEKQVSVAQLVLAATLQLPGIGMVIPGAKHPEQVVDNMKTLDVPMTATEALNIRRIFS